MPQRTSCPFSEDDRKLILATREYLSWVNGSPHPHRWWIDEAAGLIRGDLVRVWERNPRFMEPKQPVGWWTTQKRVR